MKPTSFIFLALAFSPSLHAQSVARQWNEEILAAIRIDVPNPPVHARNLFHLATGMYDAWAAYDATALGYLHHERVESSSVGDDREKAISFAAYRILSARYANSVSAAEIAEALDARMVLLGYDKSVTATDGDSPAALGNRIAAGILAWGLNDGSGQSAFFFDPTYVNTQPEFPILLNGVPLTGYPAGSDPDRWHPLTFDEGFSQNGLDPVTLQPFVGATWLGASSFALRRSDGIKPWFDPGPPPRLRGEDADPDGYRAEALDVLWKSQGLGSMQVVDISPGARGNNTLGTDDGSGHAINPATGLPYEPELVPLGDYGRVLAEYWADGPDSETPPGHWHVIANESSDELLEKRIGGTGPLVDDLEWDVKLYFALSAGTHDAACAAWSLKRYYDSARPISMIRHMALMGQSSDPELASYHPEGLPLVPGLISLVTPESLNLGGEHLGSGLAPGDVAVLTWPGRPEDPTVQRSLPRWIKGTDWFPYQDRTFVTPSFPGYVSGHSTFSRAAAEVLTAMTGSEFFPNGLGHFTATAGSYLRFEYGPSIDVNLQWATYYDAADEAGASRRWGGIHPPVDDLPGRIIGSRCGKGAWLLAKSFWEGDVWQKFPPRLDLTGANGEVSLEWGGVAGLWTVLEASDDLQIWSPVTEPIQGRGTNHQSIEPSDGTRFYRTSGTLVSP